MQAPPPRIVRGFHGYSVFVRPRLLLSYENVDVENCLFVSDGKEVDCFICAPTARMAPVQ